MKIIALLPFKNEAWVLKTYLSGVLPIVDEIIAIDDGSTDDSVEILRSANASIFSNTEKALSGWAEHSIRMKLLALGRQHGGTHFVCLDADETFTAPFFENYSQYIKLLRPGQKLSLQWLALWESPHYYRADQSVWSNNFKDFIVCDDGMINHDYAFLGVGRTPGANTGDNWLRVKPEDGAVFHFQNVIGIRNQVKQAWYRCSELIKDPTGFIRINGKYAITLADPSARVAAVPPSWQKNIIIPSDQPNQGAGWQLAEILKWFDQYGANFFEPLQIWHIDELKQEFVRRLGRSPKSISANDQRRSFWQRIRNRIKKLF
jgi:glycosyltransferase involved in cell wall biosynthesis